MLLLNLNFLRDTLSNLVLIKAITILIKQTKQKIMSAGLSPAANRLLNVFVSGGAAIVIVGALFKIQHYKGADIMLPIGLLLEAAIFVVYAILPPDEVAHAKEEGEGSALNSMEEMMAAANINQDNLSKLSANFSKFNTTVEKMSEIGDVVKSAGDFSAKTKEATTAMGSVATAVSSATSSLGAFNEASESTKQFHGQIQILAKNLNRHSVRTIYQL